MNESNTTPVKQIKHTVISPHGRVSVQSPLAPKNANYLLKQLCENQRKQARKYSSTNLYQIRHCFREMPKNIEIIPNVLAPGLGLQSMYDIICTNYHPNHFLMHLT